MINNLMSSHPALHVAEVLRPPKILRLSKLPPFGRVSRRKFAVVSLALLGIPYSGEWAIVGPL
jgi:hypothetical protein